MPVACCQILFYFLQDVHPNIPNQNANYIFLDTLCFMCLIYNDFHSKRSSTTVHQDKPDTKYTSFVYSVD